MGRENHELAERHAQNPMPKLLHLIVACSENRVIGRQGKLPWRIPEDLRYFHDETAGQICVLGRICFDTWPRVCVDGRQPIVLTSRPLQHSPQHVADREASPPLPVAVRSLAEALDVAEHLPGEVFICGGERIYLETLALSQPMLLHLTLVHAQLEGDTFFPEWRHLPWRELSRRESSDANYRYTFQTLERIMPAAGRTRP
jgi:dihydrofolate reductase